MYSNIYTTIFASYLVTQTEKNMEIRVRNTQQNASYLRSINIVATPSKSKKTLIIRVNDYHKMWIQSGQMTVSQYKKNVLGI